MVYLTTFLNMLPWAYRTIPIFSSSRGRRASSIVGMPIYRAIAEFVAPMSIPILHTVGLVSALHNRDRSRVVLAARLYDSGAKSVGP
jgi:hypothetical protein